MKDIILICSDDGKVCDMRDEEKKGMGCWNCPKIQKLNKDGKEDEDGREESE